VLLRYRRGRWLLKSPSIPQERHAEITMVPYLLRFLQEDMLLLWDRNFLTYSTVSAVIERRAHLLARISANRLFEPIEVLTDGSS
jgi:hypothetical protein